MSTITFSPLEAAVLGEILVMHRDRAELRRELCPEYQPEEIEGALGLLVTHELVKPWNTWTDRDREFFIATAKGQLFHREYARQLVDQWLWSGGGVPGAAAIA